MGETANEKTSAIKNWLKGLKAEFKKIIWPDKKFLGKQTVVVVIITTILSVIIALLDLVIKFGIDLIM